MVDLSRSSAPSPPGPPPSIMPRFFHNNAQPLADNFEVCTKKANNCRALESDSGTSENIYMTLFFFVHFFFLACLQLGGGVRRGSLRLLLGVWPLVYFEQPGLVVRVCVCVGVDIVCA